MPTQLSITNLTSGVQGSASNYNTGSVTPLANQIMLVTVSSNVTSGSPNVPTPTLTGWTFHQVATVTGGPFSTNVDRITLFVGVGSGNGAINIDFASQTQNRMGYVVDQINHTPLTGAGGANAIQQSTALNQHSSGFNVSLSAFNNINNGTYVVTTKDAVNTVVPGGSLTKIAEQEVSGSPNWGIASMFQPTNNTNPTGTFAGSGGDDVETIAAEIVFKYKRGGFIL